jgi:hypothetical protein
MSVESQGWLTMYREMAMAYFKVQQPANICFGGLSWCGNQSFVLMLYSVLKMETMFLRNVSIHLQIHTEPQPRRRISTVSPSWELQISQFFSCVYKLGTVDTNGKPCMLKIRVWRGIAVFIFEKDSKRLLFWATSLHESKFSSNNSLLHY